VNKEELIQKVVNLQDELSNKTLSLSSIQSDVDELDMSYNISSIKEAIEEVESDINQVTESLDEIVQEIRDYTGNPNGEHIDVHNRLVRNCNDVMNLLATLMQRVNTVQARGFEYSSYHYDYTTSDTEKKLSDGMYRLYWLLIDISGYSDEQFQDKLVSKEIEYKVKDLPVEENVKA
jgi:chromosome segregation ATPase